ncbi:hypothetical protein ACOSP7_027650 [Xanthoceras sorbifolium]
MDDPMTITKRLLAECYTPSTVEEIEAKFRHANILRQSVVEQPDVEQPLQPIVNISSNLLPPAVPVIPQLPAAAVDNVAAIGKYCSN